MKKTLFFSAALIICTTLMAQAPQGISHQAVIRNTQGELVTAQTIGIRVSILQGSAGGTAIFVETHDPESNENGLITYVIGTGTPVSGTFAGIHWAHGPFFLKTEADPEGGTNYSITGTTMFLSTPYALHAQTADNLNYEIEENDPTWSGAGNQTEDIGRTGKVGIGTTEPLRKLTVASNNYRDHLLLFRSDVSSVFGLTSTTRVGGALEIYAANHSHAYATALMTIASAGNVGIGTDSPSALLHTIGIGTGGGNVLFDGYFKTMDPGDPPASGPGTRMMWYPDKAAFRAGYVSGTQWHKDNIGIYSFAVGRNTIAKGHFSMAMGDQTTASGGYSTAMGNNTTASGGYSTAMGNNTTASGSNSTAMGSGTTASAPSSTAMGIETTASGWHSTAIGYQTTASGDFSTAMGSHTTASGHASTAMGIYARAGAYAFAINLNTSTGPLVPESRFQITGASAIGGNTSWNNWSDKRMKKDVQFLENENSLEKIMKLQGVRFRWKESNPDVADRYYLGFLAQDVLEVMSEPVLYDELNDIYSLEYTAIIPVLVEAIKEQQATIELLIKRIEALETEK